MGNAKKKVLQPLDMTGNNITGLPSEPSGNDAAASKAYVDSKAAPVSSVNTKTGAVVLAAGDIAITDTSGNFTTDTVQGAIDELFQFANNGKDAVAVAIGYEDYSGTFATLASNVSATVGDLQDFLGNAQINFLVADKLHELGAKLAQAKVLKTRVKLRKTINQTETITLNTAVNAEYMLVTPLRLVGDISTTPFSATFDNSEAGSFVANSNITYASGDMKIAVQSVNLNKTFVSTETGGLIYGCTIDMASLLDIRFTANANTTITYETLPNAQVVRASGDINMSTVGDFQVFIERTTTTDGNVRLAASFAGTGAVNSYKAWNGSSWVSITDITDASEFATKGMTQTTLNNMTVANWDAGRTSDDLRFAYYIYQPSFADTTSINDLTVSGFLEGYFEPANTSVTVTRETSQLITCRFNATDTYQLNWFDTPE